MYKTNGPLLKLCFSKNGYKNYGNRTEIEKKRLFNVNDKEE